LRLAAADFASCVIDLMGASVLRQIQGYCVLLSFVKDRRTLSVAPA
jgi:hypothetical protein